MHTLRMHTQTANVRIKLKLALLPSLIFPQIDRSRRFDIGKIDRFRARVGQNLDTARFVIGTRQITFDYSRLLATRHDPNAFTHRIAHLPPIRQLAFYPRALDRQAIAIVDRVL